AREGEAKSVEGVAATTTRRVEFKLSAVSFNMAIHFSELHM
ncbi:unnamed protein product, partial [Urochloa humidicola]